MRFGKAQIDHLNLIAPLGIETDRRAHEGGDAVELFFWARLIGDLAFVILVVDAVDEHSRRDAVDAPCLDDLGFCGARDLVVDDFLGLAALVAAAAAVRWLLLRSAAAGQFGADGHRALLVVACGGLLFAGLA